MNTSNSFLHVRYLIFLSFCVLAAFSLFMSGVRVYIFITHTTQNLENYSDLLSALWLGFRLDASILAYILAPVVIYLLLLWLMRASKLVERSYTLVHYYFYIFLLIVSALLVSDIAYFSFFSEHITLMIFGIFDDDTRALFEIAKKNYNLLLVGLLSLVYLVSLYFTLKYIFHKRPKQSQKNTPFIAQIGYFLAIIIVVGLVGRGSVGIFPLAKDIADVSENPLINKLPKNGVYAMVDAYEQYAKSKDGSYDLIKMSGYKGKIEKAFASHVRAPIDKQNLLNSLLKTTPKNTLLEKNPPHVVVVMVESFGLPILKYQSEEFDILRRLKKHFDADTLFTNFISASNGTIVSLEPLLLNITARPKSTSFAQSSYLNTEFQQASARVYEEAGYETSFVYGGDLSWRNVGSFMSRQGFEHTYGKASIAKTLHVESEDAFHDWGIYDKYSYDFVLQKLQNATKPQFIFLLTTNNHPPYVISKEYKSKELLFSKELNEHITGDKDLAKKRFQDYQYALDMAGRFMDKLKSSPLAKNTVVAITADNNTVEGIMHYDDYYNETKKIPFYLYLPQYLHVSIDTSIAGSHKDIFPTLYNLTLSQQPYLSIGTDLRDKKALHCGFNDAGIIMAQDGGFQVNKPKTPAQKECAKYYKASLAVSEYLIQSSKKR